MRTLRHQPRELDRFNQRFFLQADILLKRLHLRGSRCDHQVSLDERVGQRALLHLVLQPLRIEEAKLHRSGSQVDACGNAESPGIDAQYVKHTFGPRLHQMALQPYLVAGAAAAEPRNIVGVFTTLSHRFTTQIASSLSDHVPSNPVS